MEVYHSGEQAVQRMAGVEAVAEQNGKSIQPNISRGAAVFLEKQSLVVAASSDLQGRVWSSILTGPPGFLHVEDEVTLTIRSKPVPSDPLIDNVRSNPELGLLVIDLAKRIRLRLNGKGVFSPNGSVVVTAEQVYGNCPKYIQKRTLYSDGVFHRLQQAVHRSSSLSLDQQRWIREADTFFIGTMSREGKVDASHRGGLPGFVQIVNERTLLFPDYFGNSMFNTLGNIYSNPQTGVVFVDFRSGHTLQLTGQSVIIWDERQISAFPGAERLVRFTMEEALFTENDTQLGWDLVEYSPANPPL